MVDTGLALGVTVLTLAAFTALGVWFSRGHVRSVEDFVSARDSAGGGTLTATLIASSMGAWILLSPAEVGTSLGLTAVVGYGIGSAVPMALYAVLGPRIRTLMPAGHSLTEYAHARYGPFMHGYVLLVSASYMFIFLAAELTGITTALGLVADVPRWATAGLVGAFVLVYTAYGGLRASIVTDTVQTLLILPLLVVGFAGAVLALGGTGQIHEQVLAANPALLDPGFGTGLAAGFTFVLAILGAEMLNQAWWQRIFAASDGATLRRSFAVTAVAVVPMVVAAGLFGLVATGLGLVGEGQASVAFFLVVDAAFPEWITLSVVVLATLLVMSTTDTLFNALSSLVTADLPRLLDDPDRRTLTLGARLLTVAVALGSVYVALAARSVLALFLLADLLAAATFVPLLAGLYSRRVTELGVLAAAVVGLAVGAAFFPDTNAALAGLLGAARLPAPSLLYAFVGAVACSAGLTALAAGIGAARGRSYEFDRLERDVTRLGDAPAATDGGRDDTEPEVSDR
ncbi:sodium:solute symporter family transporter [Halorientalis halophila]|uniref:sodium:solute symporter family transporter n=1 Tax=Halorientalis halophila TaxID=3108499 RepID=UPI00300ABAC8